MVDGATRAIARAAVAMSLARLLAEVAAPEPAEPPETGWTLPVADVAHLVLSDQQAELLRGLVEERVAASGDSQ